MKKLLTLLIFLIFFTTISEACSCRSRPPVKEEFNNADAVFTGKLISGGSHYIFETSLVFKGNIGKSVKLYRLSGSSCNYGFKEGNDYVVYCKIFGDAYQTHYCMRTRYLDEQGISDVAELAELTDRTLNDIRTLLPEEIRHMTHEEIHKKAPNDSKIKRQQYKKKMAELDALKEKLNKEKKEEQKKELIKTAAIYCIFSTLALYGVRFFLNRKK